MQIDAENIVLITKEGSIPGVAGQVATMTSAGTYEWCWPRVPAPQTYGRHAHPFHYIDKVAEFHQRFKVEPGNMELRKALILEELKELQQAVKEDSRKDIVDGLCDVIYVVAGTQLAAGYGVLYKRWTPSFKIDLLMKGLQGVIQELHDKSELPPNALAELIDICHKIADTYNIDIWTNFMLVHENNMSKTWTEEQVSALPSDCAYGITPTDDGRYIIKSPAGKVLKPPGHVTPTLVL